MRAAAEQVDRRIARPLDHLVSQQGVLHPAIEPHLFADDILPQHERFLLRVVYFVAIAVEFLDRFAYQVPSCPRPTSPSHLGWMAGERLLGLQEPDERQQHLYRWQWRRNRADLQPGYQRHPEFSDGFSLNVMPHDNVSVRMKLFWVQNDLRATFSRLMPRAGIRLWHSIRSKSRITRSTLM
jgi:hypothetical protein